MTEASIGSARIEVGVIAAVNTEEAVCTVRTETSEVFHDNIPFATIGLHQESGTGLSYFPQASETVLVLTTSDGKRCVLAYLPAVDDKGTYAAGRENNNPGDWKLTGADGNFLEILRGGIVRIGASEICQTIYIPTRALVHQISENLIIDTFAGSLEFNVSRAEDDPNGKQKCSFKLNIQEYADDKQPSVAIEGGTGYSITVSDSGSLKASITIKKTGELEIVTKQTYTLTSSADIILKAQNKTAISGSTIELKGNTTSVEANSLTIKAGTTDIKSNIALTGTLRAGKFPVLTMSAGMGAWMAKVGAFTQSPPPADCVSTAVFA
jgi:aspartate carbamoyltransferase regulatory subunit